MLPSAMEYRGTLSESRVWGEVLPSSVREFCCFDSSPRAVDHICSALGSSVALVIVGDFGRDCSSKSGGGCLLGVGAAPFVSRLWMILRVLPVRVGEVGGVGRLLFIVGDFGRDCSSKSGGGCWPGVGAALKFFVRERSWSLKLAMRSAMSVFACWCCSTRKRKKRILKFGVFRF